MVPSSNSKQLTVAADHPSFWLSGLENGENSDWLSLCLLCFSRKDISGLSRTLAYCRNKELYNRLCKFGTVIYNFVKIFFLNLCNQRNLILYKYVQNLKLVL